MTPRGIYTNQRSASGRRKSWLLSALICDILVMGLKEKEHECRDRGYFQINWLPSFILKMGSCVAETQTHPGWPIYQHEGPINFWVHGVLFMGSDSSYIHIQYNFQKERGAERTKYAIEKNNLWSGAFKRVVPLESCFAKLRWREAVVILWFFPYLLPHEVFYQLLLRNKYRVAPTGGDGLSEGLVTLTQWL